MKNLSRPHQTIQRCVDELMNLLRTYLRDGIKPDDIDDRLNLIMDDLDAAEAKLPDWDSLPKDTPHEYTEELDYIDFLLDSADELIDVIYLYCDMDDVPDPEKQDPLISLIRGISGSRGGSDAS